MCVATGRPPALECTLAEVPAGTEFHTPDGERWMVLSLPRTAEGDPLVANLGNAPEGGYNPYGRQGSELRGRVTPMRGDVKLGRDHRGRLYASTALNDWYLYESDLPLPYPEEVAPDMNLLNNEDAPPAGFIEDAQS